MDKSKWEYKKLGEVASIKTGKLDANAANENGLYPFFTCSREPLSINSYSYDCECILVAGNGELNVKYYKGKFDAYQRTYIIQLKDGIRDIDMHYLYMFFSKYIEVLRKKSIGGVIKYIKLGDLTEAHFPLYPKDYQQRIVSELDCLNEMIAVKQEQLKEFDKLAQSIFYDMFGDPVANGKGWKKCCLQDVCSKINDGTHNSPVNEESGDYMYVTAKNIKKDGIILNNITYVSESVHRQIYDRCNPEYGDVLYIKDGVTTGIATINTLKEEFSLLSSVALLKPDSCINNQYLKAVLNTPSMYNLIRSDMGGVAITRLTIAKINKICIPLPPLTLQQQFADKISAIEAQKELIKQSIAETQHLFDSKMDYYFD